MSNFKIATLGCSHSSYFAGTPWPVPLASMLGSDLKMSYSAGAGNEMNILKLKQLLEEHEPDLVIAQLTDPNRFVVGLDYDTCHKNILFENLTGTHNVKNVTYYTFNHTSNIQYLEHFVGKRFHRDLDEFIINHVITSDYNLNHKIIHTICAMENMARSYSTPIVFFSWSIDLHKLIIEQGYSRITKNFHIIPDYIENFVLTNNLCPEPEGTPAGGHHGTDNHVVIAKDYILPYLMSKNLVPGSKGHISSSV